jgi:hypothetical protein
MNIVNTICYCNVLLLLEIILLFKTGHYPCICSVHVIAHDMIVIITATANVKIKVTLPHHFHYYNTTVLHYLSLPMQM